MRNQALSAEKILVFSYFIGIIVIGTSLLVLPGIWRGGGALSWHDALFTATSAVCVTGLTVVDTAQFSLAGQWIILALIQFGGLGLITFGVLFLMGGRRRISLAGSAVLRDMFIGEVEYQPRAIIKSVVVTTLLVESAGALLLWPRFVAAGGRQPLFTAFFHAVSAFCNAGFSTFPNSLEGFRDDWVINLVVMVLIVSGGIGFVVFRDVINVVRRRKRHLSYHTRLVLRLSGGLILAGALLFFGLEYRHALSGLAWPEKILAAFFQAVTTRTAGFDTVAQATFSLPSVLLVLLLMFIGGSPGSTAGGVKTTTIFTAALAALDSAREDGSFVYKGGYLTTSVIARAFMVLARAALILAVSFFLLLLFELPRGQAGFVALLFETISAFGTVGLTLGITPTLGLAGKLLIVATMFIGRIGLFAMIIAQSRKSIERYAEFPAADIMIG
ncbi:MAG: hypothetical protein A2087_02380 [Spirochaetes bacterium GWD1_61_31]|nr:MAG: hypothetical protein A2Y37_00800 [Spirochaetes bacterium GWB1_60_80]OHD34564.1 MAG: hypothetical protein A2004_11720 [Spirochaetes bacterium GWC1_61_12]OHD44013.1 MAG: hypothetical protein A2087_02380 [Spirochaetes bacterium GWD1_61_31]OHD46175.1 MAG: hypothetical protein A2Y35_00725 [Spirochaetes bacterium GWE1_60_18]OHD60713.1 MAG: hypothetical protein A2Y32_07530 [Spirochaetes bacterium GWF1_60_12]HAP43899.1 potassium transporter [Spirochaetaceae bacterium]